MPTRRGHYERALAAYLRDRAARFIPVDDARRALLREPGAARTPALRPAERERLARAGLEAPPEGRSLKSFDLVLYGRETNLLLDVKGRKVAAAGGRAPRLESWATRDDVASLLVWEALFGPGFEGAFAFVYWWRDQPPAALFEESFAHMGRWYAVRTVRLADYRAAMTTRSERWGTVHLPTDAFERCSAGLLDRATA